MEPSPGCDKQTPYDRWVVTPRAEKLSGLQNFPKVVDLEDVQDWFVEQLWNDTMSNEQLEEFGKHGFFFLLSGNTIQRIFLGALEIYVGMKKEQQLDEGWIETTTVMEPPPERWPRKLKTAYRHIAVTQYGVLTFVQK